MLAKKWENEQNTIILGEFHICLQNYFIHYSVTHNIHDKYMSKAVST